MTVRVTVTVRVVARITVTVRVTVRVRVRIRVRREVINVNDPEIGLGDHVCDFEKVPPDQLCPSAKKTTRFTHSIPRIHAHAQG